MSQTALQPKVDDGTLESGRWMTLIFDDDITPLDLVIATVMSATGCDLQEAYTEAWEAQTYGKAPVHFATHKECEVAAGIIAAIGVKVEVAKEWND